MREQFSQRGAGGTENKKKNKMIKMLV
jgi:hypothetical protein